MNTFILILILNVPTNGAYERPVVVQQEFTSLSQCKYVMDTILKQNKDTTFISGGCFLK